MSDAVLIGATWCSATRSKMHPKERLAFFALVVGNAGLLMVDHIHFQYNGMLLGTVPQSLCHSHRTIIAGMLIWSIVEMEQEHCVLSAILFAVLLNLKHLFVYSAAVFFGYLLRHKCLQSGSLQWGALCKLVVVVLTVLGLSFGPFLVHGQLSQVRKTSEMLLSVVFLDSVSAVSFWSWSMPRLLGTQCMGPLCICRQDLGICLEIVPTIGQLF